MALYLKYVFIVFVNWNGCVVVLSDRVTLCSRRGRASLFAGWLQHVGEQSCFQTEGKEDSLQHSNNHLQMSSASLMSPHMYVLTESYTKVDFQSEIQIFLDFHSVVICATVNISIYIFSKMIIYGTPIFFFAQETLSRYTGIFLWVWLR